MVLLRSNKVTMEPPKSTEAAEPTNPAAEPSNSTEGSVPFVPEPTKSTGDGTGAEVDRSGGTTNPCGTNEPVAEPSTRQKGRFRQKNCRIRQSGGSAKSFANSGTDRRISADRGDGGDRRGGNRRSNAQRKRSPN
ncbi:unnamed protein product [Microthlaspi erraticum]|uniref:Uncharacterized protein n=1 Tax=Microthlaspi erraticum TaxID=1685480 RepID=A0A6D2J3V1_9BRAS|nr:unnamed protein product [Microthlaspi erraticum]